MSLVTPWLKAEPKRYALIRDYRLDNMRSTRTGPASLWWTGADGQIGLPGRDLAYFTATSLIPTPDRRSRRTSSPSTTKRYSVTA